MRWWAAVLVVAACDQAPVVEALPDPDAEVVVLDAAPRASGKARPDAKVKDSGLRADAARADDAAPARPAEPDRPAESPYEVQETPGEAPTYVIEGSAEPESPPPPSPSAAPIVAFPTSPTKGPLLIADAKLGRIDVLSRKAEPLGRITLPGAIIRGISHDRRSGDGVWILVAGSPPRVAKIAWDGRRLAAFDLSRPPLARARRFMGIDHVMGHTAASDLILVMYVNRLGVPVIEGVRIRDGTSRFAIGSSKEANLGGVRADGIRHSDVDGLLVLDWWTVRDGNRLERWRFFHGFVDRTDERRLAAPLTAFDIPPWREVWGVSDRKVLRLAGDGALVETLPSGDVDAASVAIAP